jgi:methionyl aminopeptidase
MLLPRIMSKRQQRRREERRRSAAEPSRAHASASSHATRVHKGKVSPLRTVPAEIGRPPYARAAGVLAPVFPPGTFAERMRAAGRAAGEVLEILGAAVRPGITTDELDALAHDAYIRLGGFPSTLGYHGYEKSICTSVNEIVCHGIPDDRPLGDGDIVNCDVTIYLDGVHGDTSATFAVGAIDPELARLVAVTRQCLWRGIRAVRPGAPVNAIGRAIQEHAEGHGFSVVRTFVGHGIGEEFHTTPSVPHYFDARADEPIEAGMTFTIEPMINAGGWRVGRTWSDGWTAPTADGSASAQFEHTLLVGRDGAEVLTLRDGETPDYGD